MTAFDAVAPLYRRLWSNAPSGKAQREASWRVIDPLFSPGARVLDVGCGIGDDAVHLAARGIDVLAIDRSPEMIRIARERGVAARVLAIEDLSALPGPFDGAISNFGALNCVASLEPAGRELGRLIVRGGRLAIGILGNFCAWETVRNLCALDLGKATRRLRGSTWARSLGLRVFYPRRAEVVRALEPHFRLVSWSGIGVTVPPSYVGLSAGMIGWLATLDRHVAHRRVLRAGADHRLYVFERI